MGNRHLYGASVRSATLFATKHNMKHIIDAYGSRYTDIYRIAHTTYFYSSTVRTVGVGLFLHLVPFNADRRLGLTWIYKSYAGLFPTSNLQFIV
jgi:hypothetical protein